MKKKTLYRALYSVYFILITQLLISCNSGDYPTAEEFYSLKDTIRGEMLDNPIISKSISARIYCSDKGLVVTSRINNNIIQLLDTSNARSIISYGRIGRGPNEFLSPSSQHLNIENSDLNLLDFYKQELQLFKINSDTITPLGIVNIKRDLQRVCYLNDSLIVYISFYPNQKFGVLNKSGDMVYEEDFDILKDKRILTDKRYHSAYMEISEYNNAVIIANSKFTIVESYSFIDNKLQLNWRKALLEPEYSVKDGWYKFASKDQPLGFRNLYLTDNYIYLLCDDRSLNEVLSDKNKPHSYIVVMDYDGNIIKKHLLDRFLFSFAVNSNDTTLYAVTDDGWNFRIVKYDLL